MDPTTLTLDQIKAFLGSLLGAYRVLAPTERDGVTGYDWIAAADDVQLPPGGIPKVPAKQALLPRSEVLFYYTTGKDTEAAAPPPPPTPQVIFGLHPCDVQGVKVLDAVFSAEPYPDGPYLARREVTALIGLGAAPDEKPETCFFEEVGIGSMDNRDCDLFLVPLGDERFVLEVLTDTGRALTAHLPDAPTASAEDLALRDRLRDQAAARVTTRFSSEQFREHLTELFDADLWARLGQTCAACGACAYLCPTCHCFDIQDEVHGRVGARVRTWDTCQFDLFTMHASGHNPRTQQTQRARQRILHKFDYGTKNFHLPFCVGCGRCITTCPMHGNLLTTLQELERMQPEGTNP